jgi:hypothetical protein
VYSKEDTVSFDEKLNTNNIPIVYIRDTENKYYDFYKYKLGCDYIINNKIPINWVFIMNDSVIFTENVSWIIKKINQSNNTNYYGIIESKGNVLHDVPAKKHYQSWWLNFRPNAFKYFYNHLKFNKNYTINTYDKYNDIKIGIKYLINDLEINLSNEMISKFKTSVMFPYVGDNTDSSFWNKPLFDKYYNNNNFKIMKVKNIKPELLPPNLKKMDFRNL